MNLARHDYTRGTTELTGDFHPELGRTRGNARYLAGGAEWLLLPLLIKQDGMGREFQRMECEVPEYLTQARYAGDSVKGLLKDGGPGRRAVLEKAIEALRGSLECVYYAYGEDDLFVIFDMPDNVTMTALCLGVRAASPFTIKTTPLMTPEEMDEVAKKSSTYRGP